MDPRRLHAGSRLPQHRHSLHSLHQAHLRGSRRQRRPSPQGLVDAKQRRGCLSPGSPERCRGLLVRLDAESEVQPHPGCLPARAQPRSTVSPDSSPLQLACGVIQEPQFAISQRARSETANPAVSSSAHHHDRTHLAPNRILLRAVARMSVSPASALSTVSGSRTFSSTAVA